MYQLGFPNDEVRYGFLHFLLPDYVYGETTKAGFHVARFSAEEALAQIDRQGYLLPYSADGRTLVKLGVAFDAAERNIGRWLQG
jgi:hypothetical protein